MRATRLVLLLLTGAALTLAAHGGISQGAREARPPAVAATAGARLRPTAAVSLPPHTAFISEDLGGNWFAWTEAGVPSASIHLYDIAARTGRILRPALLRGERVADLVHVAWPWVAWVQYGPGGGWQLCVADVASGAAWVADSAAREGLPATAPRFGDANLAVGGDLLVWTTHRVRGGEAASVVLAQNLRSRARSQVAATGDGLFLWPATDGAAVAWEHWGRAGAERVRLVDLRRGREVRLPGGGPASQPGLRDGLLVWKRGTNFGAGAGVAAYALRTGRLVAVAAPGASMPMVGDGVVGYRVPSTNTLGLYDLRASRGFQLDDRQLRAAGGEFFGDFRLSGGYAKVSGGFEDNRAIVFAFFRLSKQHPFSDLYR